MPYALSGNSTTIKGSRSTDLGSAPTQNHQRLQRIQMRKEIDIQGII
jgi:hypothetical protein